MDTIQRSTDNHTRIQRWALVMSSLILALPLSAAAVFGWVLKSINPDDVDITAGLAYLGPILLTGWIVAGAVIMIAVVLNIVTTRKGSSNIHWVIFGLQLLMLLVLVLSNMATESLI